MGKSLLLRNCNWNNHLLNRNHWVKAFKGLLHVLSMKCPIYEISYLWNVLFMKYLSMKCPYMKCPLWNVHIWNVLSIECPYLKFSLYWMSSMKCPIYWMSSMKCPIFEMSYLWNVLSMKYPSMKCPYMKCPLYWMSYIKCPVYEMSYPWNVQCPRMRCFSMKWSNTETMLTIPSNNYRVALNLIGDLEDNGMRRFSLEQAEKSINRVNLFTKGFLYFFIDHFFPQPKSW